MEQRLEMVGPCWFPTGSGQVDAQTSSVDPFVALSEPLATNERSLKELTRFRPLNRPGFALWTQ
jgi:hypothetical protein